MGYGNKATLLSVFNDQNFLNEVDPAKIEEIGAQVTDVIRTYTGITPPADPANAPGILRNIWTNIVQFQIIPYQKDLSDDEKQRRTTLFNGAYKMLEKIQTGDLKVLDANGAVLNASNSLFQIQGTKRIDVMP